MLPFESGVPESTDPDFKRKHVGGSGGEEDVEGTELGIAGGCTNCCDILLE